MSLLRSTAISRALLSSRASSSFTPAFSLSARSYTTPSEEAAKGEKHNKSPEQLQKEHTEGSKVTASPNQQPTQSEEAVHAEKKAAGKTPEQLQKETAGKA
ncbi:hypothetical protein V8E36_006370 [Tilletia maclaganii]